VAHNLGQAPDGSVPTQFGMVLQASTGEQIPLAGQTIVGSHFDAPSDGQQLVVKATLPPDLPPGFYELLIMVNDPVKEAQFALPVPVWVTG
jgi:hypothetical protein